MCHVFAGTDPALYESVRRSVRLDGVVTSIRIERRFWQILEDVATAEDLSLPQFLSALHREVSELRGDPGNFASLLRVVATLSLERKPAA